MRIEHWRYAVPLWVRGLFRRRAVEREMDDEIRNHIESQTAANVACGMTPDDARRAALVAFGGVERIKDENRDARRLSLIDSVAQLRLAARSLRRAPTFSVAAIVTIALAVGAACTVFTLVDTVLLRPLPYADSDRLVALWHSFPGIGMPLAPQAPGTYYSYRTSSRSFESIGAYSGGTATINYDDAALEPEQLPAAGVAAGVFTTLRTHPIMGRVFTDADEAVGAPPVAVVSESFWRTRLEAAPDIVGRRIRVDGGIREIVGVLPGTFAFPGSDVRIWMPINVTPGAYLGSFGFRAIGRLRPGVSIAAAQRELQSILMRTPETFPNVGPGMSTAQALAKTRAVVVLHSLRDDAVADFAHILWLVAAIVTVLVIVAFSNVASLALARAEARRREFAVRTALGASTARVWWSLVAEGAIVSAIGAAAGIGMSVAALGLLGHAGPTEFPDPRMANGGVVVLPRLDEVHPDGMLAVSALALAALFCLLIGMIGAWRTTSSDAGRILRDGGRSGTFGRASQRMRALFVVVEVALSLVLLSGSAVLGRSVLRLLDVRPGFNPANVITFWTSPPRAGYRDAEDVARYYRGALERIERIPGVAAAGIISKPPLEFAQTRRIVWVEGSPRASDALPPDYPVAEASNGYFAAMGIPLVAGRLFDAANVQRGNDEAVVSREFVLRNWGDSTGTSGIGHRFRAVGNVGPWYTIVGVVGDVRDTSLTAAATAELYLPRIPARTR